MFFKNLKYNLKYKIQRLLKGYSDEDLFSIDDWFLHIFPKMLGDFVEETIGLPCNEDILKKEVFEFPIDWIENQIPIIDNKLKQFNKKFDIEDGMCHWLLIILRIKYCFEMCDENKKEYQELWDKQEYDELDKEINKYKKEAFYLFEKYFFNLWW